LTSFSGCGGFSLGMERAGFNVLAAIDFNPEAIQVFRRNFPDVPHVLQKDLTSFPPGELAKLIDADEVDVIVGGDVRSRPRSSKQWPHQFSRLFPKSRRPSPRRKHRPSR
jgi:hypothetical protein